MINPLKIKWTVKFCCFEKPKQEIDYEATDRDFRAVGRKLIEAWEAKNRDVAGQVTFTNELGRLCE